MTPSFRSLLFLGAYFALHWLRRLKRILTGAPPQLPIFQRQFENEGLGRFTSEERALLDRLSRCLACGWCEAGDRPMAAPDAHPPSPSALALALTRDPEDFPHTQSWRRAMVEAEISDALCPFGVPLESGMDFLARYHGGEQPAEPSSPQDAPTRE